MVVLDRADVKSECLVKTKLKIDDFNISESSIKDNEYIVLNTFDGLCILKINDNFCEIENPFICNNRIMSQYEIDELLKQIDNETEINII